MTNETGKRVVRLLACQSSFEANLIVGRLDNEGIPSFLSNDNISTLLPHINGLFGAGVQVNVFEKDLERAREILARDEV